MAMFLPQRPSESGAIGRSSSCSKRKLSTHRIGTNGRSLRLPNLMSMRPDSHTRRKTGTSENETNEVLEIESYVLGLTSNLCKENVGVKLNIFEICFSAALKVLLESNDDFLLLNDADIG